MNDAPEWLKPKSIDLLDPESCEIVIDDLTGQPKKVLGIVVCGAPIGDDVFVRSWLAAKTNEICSSIDKITHVLSSRSAKAAFSVTHLSSFALADFICSTNLPS